MTSRISLIAAVFAAGSLASCSDDMTRVSSYEADTERVLAASADMPPLAAFADKPPLAASADSVSPAGIGFQGASYSSSMETSQEPAAPAAPPIPDRMTRNVVDGICEGTTCMGNDPSPAELAGYSGIDDFVSATNDQ